MGDKLTEQQIADLADGSIVRRNLLTRPGYMPYCGAVRCSYGMPRTAYEPVSGQFICGCGWVSKFSDEMVAAVRRFRT